MRGMRVVASLNSGPGGAHLYAFFPFFDARMGAWARNAVGLQGTR